MHHMHIDRFAGLDSPVHRMDPRLKVVTVLTAILTIVMTPDNATLSYIVYGAALMTVILMSGVPAGYLVTRSLTVFPFALAVAVFVPFTTPGVTLWDISAGPLDMSVTREGLVRFGGMTTRAFLCFIATITLIATTRFGELMRAADRLGMPSRLVVVLSFMYRYLFIIIDEAVHMTLARDLRRSGRGGTRVLLASGGIVGALMVRSFEYADRLYHAMLLRGYTGAPATTRGMRMTPGDVAGAAVFLAVMLGGLIAGRMLHA